MKKAIIAIKKIHKTYQISETVATKALKGIDLTINEGDFLAIMGPSGSGKSSLMHILGLLDVPTSGTFHLNGKATHNLSEDELADIRNEQLGFVFQAFNLLPRTSAIDNVKLPMIYKGIAPEEQTKIAKKALKDVGLADFECNKPNELSGGQQQRVAIARALVNNPKVIFADEPTGNLDSASSKEIMTIFKRLNKEGRTIIMVTHEKDIAKNAKRTIHLKDGIISHIKKH